MKPFLKPTSCYCVNSGGILLMTTIIPSCYTPKPHLRPEMDNLPNGVSQGRLRDTSQACRTTKQSATRFLQEAALERAHFILQVEKSGRRQ
jgi:hypothetical protein